VPGVEVTPGAAAKAGGTHTCSACWQDVVVQPITDVEDGCGGDSRGVDDPMKSASTPAADNCSSNPSG